MINLVVAPNIWDRYHRTLLEAPAVLLTGRIERAAGTVNLVVRHTDALDIALPRHRRNVGHRLARERARLSSLRATRYGTKLSGAQQMGGALGPHPSLVSGHSPAR